MFAGLEAGHQALIDGVAQYAASHRRGIEIAKMNVDVGLSRTWHPYLHGIDLESLDAAVLEQRVPVQLALDLAELRLGANGGFDDAHLFCNRQAAAQDDLVFRDHGHGGPGDGVQADDALVRPARTHFDFGADKFAQVLIDKFGELQLRDTQQQDRLGMPQHPDPGDDSLGVHADQGHHRLARVGGNVDDVGGQKDVADQFPIVFPAMAFFLAVAVFLVMAAFPALVGLDIGRLAHAVGKAVGARQYILAGDVGAKVGVGGQLRRQRRFIASADGQPPGTEQVKRCKKAGKKTGRINHGKTSKPLNIDPNKRNQSCGARSGADFIRPVYRGRTATIPHSPCSGNGAAVKPRQSCGCAFPCAAHGRSACSSTSRFRVCRL